MGLLRCKYGAPLRHCSLACRVIAIWSWIFSRFSIESDSKLSHSYLSLFVFLALTVISSPGSRYWTNVRMVSDDSDMRYFRPGSAHKASISKAWCCTRNRWLSLPSLPSHRPLEVWCTLHAHPGSPIKTSPMSVTRFTVTTKSSRTASTPPIATTCTVSTKYIYIQLHCESHSFAFSEETPSGSFSSGEERFSVAEHRTTPNIRRSHTDQ